jgi:hypothetical protein
MTASVTFQPPAALISRRPTRCARGADHRRVQTGRAERGGQKSFVVTNGLASCPVVLGPERLDQVEVKNAIPGEV